MVKREAKTAIEEERGGEGKGKNLPLLLVVLVVLRASGPPAVEATGVGVWVVLVALRRRTSAHQPRAPDGDDCDACDACEDGVGVGGPTRVGPPEAANRVPHDVQYLLWAAHGAPQPLQ